MLDQMSRTDYDSQPRRTHPPNTESVIDEGRWDARTKDLSLAAESQALGNALEDADAVSDEATSQVDLDMDGDESLEKNELLEGDELLEGGESLERDAENFMEASSHDSLFASQEPAVDTLQDMQDNRGIEPNAHSTLLTSQPGSPQSRSVTLDTADEHGVGSSGQRSLELSTTGPHSLAAPYSQEFSGDETNLSVSAATHGRYSVSVQQDHRLSDGNLEPGAGDGNGIDSTLVIDDDHIATVNQGYASVGDPGTTLQTETTDPFLTQTLPSSLLAKLSPDDSGDTPLPLDSTAAQLQCMEDETMPYQIAGDGVHVLGNGTYNITDRIARSASPALYSQSGQMNAEDGVQDYLPTPPFSGAHNTPNGHHRHITERNGITHNYQDACAEISHSPLAPSLRRSIARKSRQAARASEQTPRSRMEDMKRLYLGKAKRSAAQSKQPQAKLITAPTTTKLASATKKKIEVVAMPTLSTKEVKKIFAAPSDQPKTER